MKGWKKIQSMELSPGFLEIYTDNKTRKKNMKHLKLYENISNEVWLLKMDGHYYSHHSNNMGWVTIHQLFETQKDLQNWLINEINHFHDRLMNDNDITNDIKNTFENINLSTFEDCREFYIAFNEEYSDDGVSFQVNPLEVLKNIQIEDDIKIKINANKYNL